jgi:DNA-binding IclR family transcriptional regulator
VNQAQKIYDFIAEQVRQGVSSLTNQQIAHQTGLPEPSVRRATLRLEHAGRIRNVFSGRGNQLAWATN